MRDVIIYGTGGLAKELIGYIEGEDRGPCVLRRYRVLGCVSSEPFNNKDFDYPVWKEYPAGIVAGLDPLCFMGVADPDLKSMFVTAAPRGVEWGTYIHPSAIVSPYAKLGRGCVMTPGAILAGDAAAGEFVFMNTNATIGHDAVVGPFASMMPNSEVCGGCYIGIGAFIGIDAHILPGVSVGDGAKVSAGAIVRRDVRAGATVYGDPAKERALRVGP